MWPGLTISMGFGREDRQRLLQGIRRYSVGGVTPKIAV